LSSGTENLQAFKTQDSSATLSIQPTTKLTKRSMTVMSRLVFGSESVTGVTEFHCDSLDQSTTELLLIASPAARLQSIQSEGKEILFTESVLEDGTSRIQAFANFSTLKPKRFQVRFQQVYADAGRWNSLPFVTAPNATVSSLQVSASGLLDLPIEFDGIEGLNVLHAFSETNAKSDLDLQLPSQKQSVNLNPSVASVLPFQLFQQEQTIEKSGGTTFPLGGIHEHLWAVEIPVSKSQGGLLESNRDSLPVLRYRIRTSIDEVRGYSISLLALEGASWKYRLVGSVSRKDATFGGLLFDVPAEIASSLISENIISQFESPEPGRRLLLISPHPKTSSKQSLSSRDPFSFSIEHQLNIDQSTSGLSIPGVRLLNGPSVDQWIAVPKSTNGRKLSWTTSGVRNSKQAPENLKDFHLPASELAWYVPFSHQPEVRLNSLKGTVASPVVPLDLHRLKSLGLDVAQLDSFFILDPKGLSHVSLKLPSGMKLLSICLNGESYPFIVEPGATQSTNSSADIQLHSSVLPQFIQAIFEVAIQKQNPDEFTQEVKLPCLDELNPSKTIIEMDSVYLANGEKAQPVIWTSLSHEVLNEMILGVVESCSDIAADTAIDSTVPQRARWWGAWQTFACKLLFPTVDSVLTKSVDEWIALRDRLAFQWRLDKSLKPYLITQAADNLSTGELPQRNPAFILNSPSPDSPHVLLVHRLAPKPSLSAGASLFTGFGALMVITAIVPGLRKRSIRILDVVIHHFRIRPWRLFAVLGVIICVTLTNAWVGLILVATSLVLVLKQYVFQVRIVAARSIAKK